MTEPLSLSEDAALALREAENFCWRANVAILASEHILAGALVVLGRSGAAGLPGEDAVTTALAAIHGTGSAPLTDNVMWGSNARDALNRALGDLVEAGTTLVDARALALGLIASGEVNPAFYGAAGTTKQAVVAALG